jgi:DNA-binding transcriptional ArsR family regulator
MSNKKPQTRIESGKLDKAAFVLKAISHPTRITMIDLLDQQKELSIVDLCECLNCEKSLISHHLSNMREKGVLTVRMDGEIMLYSLRDKTITKIISCINGI